MITTWCLRGSWGGEMLFHLLCSSNERFWGGLTSHATIPLLKVWHKRKRSGRTDSASLGLAHCC